MSRLTGLLVLALLLTGCAQLDKVGPTLTRDTTSTDLQIAALEEGIAANTALAARSAAVSQELLEALTPEPGAPDPAEERFDLSVNGVSSQDFFRGLVKGTPFNMVVHPEVNGTVSLGEYR